MAEAESTFEIKKRRALIVWLYSLKPLKNLRRFGFIHYVSKKMKYAVIYMDEADLEENEKKIQKFHFVKRTERSYRPDIEMNFGEKIESFSEKFGVDPDEDEFAVSEGKTEIRLVEE